MILFALVAFVGVRSANVDVIWAWLAVGGAVLGAVALVIYMALRRRGYMESFATRLRPVTAAVKNLLHWRGLGLLAITLLIWISDGFVFWFVGPATEIDIGPLDAIALVVLASFFAMIPAAPGYLGTYDAAVVGLRGLDITKSPAVAFTLLVRFVVYVPVTLIGLALMAWRYGGLGELRPSRIRADREELREAERAAEAVTDVKTGVRVQ